MIRYAFSLLLLLWLDASAAAAPAVTDLDRLLKQGQFTQAAQLGEVLLKAQPQLMRVQFLTAYAYQMNQDYERAVKAYRALIEQHPKLPEPRNNLALIYLSKGDHAAATQLLVAAINSHNSYATVYQNLSRIYTAIASDAYRQSLSGSDRPVRNPHRVELTVIGQLESVNDLDRCLQPAMGTEIRQGIQRLLGDHVVQCQGPE